MKDSGGGTRQSYQRSEEDARGNGTSLEGPFPQYYKKACHVMQPFKRLLRKRAVLAFIDGFIVFLALLFLMVDRNLTPLTRTISYLQGQGHLLVQIAELPEHAEAEMHTIPEWTLYGDGTLLFQNGPRDDLWRAHLSPDAIQHVLDVIINHDQFFTSSAQRYGSRSNDDMELLIVDANNQQKAVTLAGEPTTSGANDIQTTHVFAIEQFLLTYHPSHAVWYAPDFDPDDNHDA